MTIQLFPCGHVPCACPECPTFEDLTREDPDGRVVIFQHNAAAGTLASGAVTWEPAGGGSPTVQGMSVVAAGQKLCLGREQSRLGPLLYATGIPVDAVITDLAFTYDPGGGPITFDMEVVGTCTDGTTQILQRTGELTCELAPSVVDDAEECEGCTENTGSSTFCGSASSFLSDYNPGGYGIGSGYCSNEHTISGSTSVLWTGLTPCTPDSTDRPCNWTDLEFTDTQTVSRSIAAPGGCGGSVDVTVTTTITKVSGSNEVTLSGSVDWSGNPTPIDHAPWNVDWPWGDDTVETSISLNCTLYRVRCSIRVSIAQRGTNSWVNGVVILGGVTVTYHLERRP
jgi:hypothetical protein